MRIRVAIATAPEQSVRVFAARSVWLKCCRDPSTARAGVRFANARENRAALVGMQRFATLAGRDDEVLVRRLTIKSAEPFVRSSDETLREFAARVSL